VGENEVKIKRRNFNTVYISSYFAYSFAELWVYQWQKLPNSFFCEYRRFRKLTKHGFAPQIFSPSRQPRKPAIHVILLPTSILAYDNHRDTRTAYTVPSKLIETMR
jgi:hypothetical protein